MLRVEFKHWKSCEGYSHSEIMEYVDNMTAEEYWRAYQDNADEPYSPNYPYGVNVELYDDDNNKVSEYFVEGR